MIKVGIAGCFAAIVAAVALAVTAAPATADGGACKRTTFKTTDVKAACAKGGQKAAKDGMKAFVKKAKAKQSDLTCKSCHSKLAPGYDLNDKGLDLYKKLGGK